LESKTNYTAVGLIVLILLGALIATGLWLSVGFDKKLYNTYAVFIHETVSGLSEESPVKYNGVKVGYVNKIMLNRDDPRQVEILLSIESGTPITVSTYATLITQGITGNTYVGLSATSGSLRPLEKLPNARWPVIPAKPSLFNQLDKVLQDVSTNINKVSLKLQNVFDDENLANFKKTMAHMETFSAVIANNSEAINHSLKNADAFLNNMKNVSGKLEASVHKFDAMTVNIGDAGKQIADSMKAGKGTIDQISQEFLPPAATLMRRLNIIAANLEELSSTLRQNPAILLRGTTPREPGPGE